VLRLSSLTSSSEDNECSCDVVELQTPNFLNDIQYRHEHKASDERPQFFYMFREDRMYPYYSLNWIFPLSAKTCMDNGRKKTRVARVAGVSESFGIKFQVRDRGKEVVEPTKTIFSRRVCSALVCAADTSTCLTTLWIFPSSL
jgi:hypothetical protein